MRLAASKLATAQALAAAGIETIPTFTLERAPPAAEGAWVVKPDDGCGCQDTHFCDDLGAAARWIEAQAGPGRFVLQPYVSGEPASVCALARDGMAWMLSVNRQRIVVRDDCFAFLGTVVNGFADDDGRCARLARDVAQAVPGLWGFFGIDSCWPSTVRSSWRSIPASRPPTSGLALRSTAARLRSCST